MFRWIVWLLLFLLLPLGLLSQLPNAIVLKAKDLSFIDSTANFFQSQQASAIGGLVELIEQRALPESKILHLGDEMVSEISVNLRKQLYGASSGLGLFFPGCLNNQALGGIVETASQGPWIYSAAIENNRLLPLGVSGYSAKTEDPNSTLTIKIPNEFQKNTDNLVIHCERSEQYFDVIVSCLGGRKSDGSFMVLSKKEFPASVSYRNAPQFAVALPAGTREILIQFKQIISVQRAFVLHGIELNNSKIGQFHSIGMRGCGYNEFCRLDLLKTQLIQLSPDLILLDFGLHDNYRGNELDAANVDPLKRSIQLIRDALPSAKILVIIPQDCIRGGRTLATFEKFETAVIALCKLERVAFYDYYRVTGGKYSAQYWADFQLFMTDGLHLQESGIALKSQLYVNSMLQTTSRYQNGYRQFIIEKDTSKRLLHRSRDTLAKPLIVSEVWRYHVVRRGETAYRIALRYGITVLQLKEWNHLRNYNISSGTRLKVGKLSIASKSDPVQTLEMKDSADAEGNANIKLIGNSSQSDSFSSVVIKKPLPKAPVKAKPVYHKVRSGETLYSISKAYGLTVDQLKRLNGLRSNNIGVGRIIRVR